MAAKHRAELLDSDFASRADTLAKAKADPEAFWRGDIITVPDDWQVPNHGWSH